MCNNEPWVGGFGVLAKGASIVRSFRLPAHYAIEIEFDFLKVDSWDNEQFLTYVDDSTIV